MNARSPLSSLAMSAVLAIVVGCAGLPAVVTSNPDRVRIEFALDGSVTEAAELAKEECEKNDKVAEFEAVDTTATPKSRIANFKCISPPSPIEK